MEGLPSKIVGAKNINYFKIELAKVYGRDSLRKQEVLAQQSVDVKREHLFVVLKLMEVVSEIIPYLKVSKSCQLGPGKISFPLMNATGFKERGGPDAFIFV